MRAKRVIITGATGFVGANLVRRLLQDEHDVHLIVRHGFTDWRIKSILYFSHPGIVIFNNNTSPI